MPTYRLWIKFLLIVDGWVQVDRMLPLPTQLIFVVLCFYYYNNYHFRSSKVGGSPRRIFIASFLNTKACMYTNGNAASRQS